MMGVFLFCGACELSDFVSLPVIPSLQLPAYIKGGRGPGALSHRAPVPEPCLLIFHAVTAAGKTVDNHL